MVVCFYFMTANRMSADLGTGLESRACCLLSLSSNTTLSWTWSWGVGVPALVPRSSSSHRVGWCFWLSSVHSDMETVFSKSCLGHWRTRLKIPRALLACQVEVHLLISDPAKMS